MIGKGRHGEIQRAAEVRGSKLGESSRLSASVLCQGLFEIYIYIRLCIYVSMYERRGRHAVLQPEFAHHIMHMVHTHTHTYTHTHTHHSCELSVDHL